MCGIAGVFTQGGTTSRESLEARARRMVLALRHRGPDGDGCWVDAAAGVALGHRRLAVVDLTVEGAQPMASVSNRYVMTYNGEVYNFRDLRAELESCGHRFRGQSDTEVMLGCIDEWGLRRALARWYGMFAIALWDRHERCLHLIRDRLGKKPLYYGSVGTDLVFASELKAITQIPEFCSTLDRAAVADVMRLGYVSGTRSIFASIVKVAPGGLVSVRMSAQGRIEAASNSYWSVDGAFAAGRGAPFTGSLDDAVTALDDLLGDAVERRMIADVPLGAFLSGGIDSTAVVAKMQQSASRPVRTFSIGFREDEFNEARHAARVAAHLGTNHTELYIATREALNLVTELPSIYDEPFADASQIPTVLLARLARSDVTVVLSGDGGDELFGGYSRYLRFRQLWRILHTVPTAARVSLGRALQHHGLVARLLRGLLLPLAPRAAGSARPHDQVSKLAAVLQLRDPQGLYAFLMTHWSTGAVTVPEGLHEAPTARPRANQSVADCLQELMQIDAGSYLPDDILVKVDRATMSVGLEARAPLLDHRLCEFAATLPLKFKIRGNEGKRVLRKLVYRHVPQELVDRRKTGFGVPMDKWLRSGLRDWAESLLTHEALVASECLRPDLVRTLWREHLSGTCDWGAQLWDVLMFQAWYVHLRRSRTTALAA